MGMSGQKRALAMCASPPPQLPPPPLCLVLHLTTPTLLLCCLACRKVWAGWPNRGRRIGEAKRPGPRVVSIEPAENENLPHIGRLGIARNGTALGVLEMAPWEEGAPLIIRCPVSHGMIEVRYRAAPHWLMRAYLCLERPG